MSMGQRPMCWSRVGRVLVACWSRVGRVLVACSWCIQRVFAVYWWGVFIDVLVRCLHDLYPCFVRSACIHVRTYHRAMPHANDLAPSGLLGRWCARSGMFYVKFEKRLLRRSFLLAGSAAREKLPQFVVLCDKASCFRIFFILGKGIIRQ
jgi:hypothetical protein